MGVDFRLDYSVILHLILIVYKLKSILAVRGLPVFS